MPRVSRNRLGVAAVSAALAAFAAPAGAYVLLKPGSAPAGAEHTATFVIDSGCAGSPTIRLRVRLPDGVSAVTPRTAEGWKVSAARTTAAVGAPIAEVIWLGGKLASGTAGEFAVTLRLPDAPGRTLYFPVTQECEKGAIRWADIPRGVARPGMLRFPAPALNLSKRP